MLVQICGKAFKIEFLECADIEMISTWGNKLKLHEKWERNGYYKERQIKRVEKTGEKYSDNKICQKIILPHLQ